MKFVKLRDANGGRLTGIDAGGYLYVVPPPSSSDNRLENGLNDLENEDFHHDDILISSYPRSGFHWIWEMVNMLQNGTSELSSLMEVQVILEMRPKEMVPRGPLRPTVLGTHLPLFLLPEKLRKLKTIFVYRNPKDIAFSLYKLFTSITYIDYNGTFEDFLPMFLEGRVPFDSWFRYMKSWEKFALENKCLVSYEEMSKQPEQCLRRIADYLKIDVDGKRLQHIVNECSLENMKKKKNIVPNVWKNGEQAIIRKGVVGGWKENFTEEMNRNFDEVFNDKMKDSKLDFEFLSKM